MKHRLFAAITLPETVGLEVVELQKSLDSLGLPVTWTPPEKLHLTLNFLGRVADEDLKSVRTVFTRVINPVSAFSLRPQFLDTLYARHEASVIYLSPSGDLDQLKQLQQAINGGLYDLKMAQQRRFLPHIVIGKLKKADPTTTKQFLDTVSKVEISPLSEFTVDKVVLFESILSAKGSHYRQLSSFALSQNPS